MTFLYKENNKFVVGMNVHKPSESRVSSLGIIYYTVY